MVKNIADELGRLLRKHETLSVGKPDGPPPAALFKTNDTNDVLICFASEETGDFDWSSNTYLVRHNGDLVWLDPHIDDALALARTGQ